MKNGQNETLRTRIISVCFTILALAVFKPFGLDAWQWEAYAHLLMVGLLGVCVCMLTELILKWVVRMPRRSDNGVEYIIRRNLWFQLINTLLVTVMICLYRHFLLSDRVEGNRLSWSNFFETLVRLLNEQLQQLQQDAVQRVDAAPSVETIEKETLSMEPVPDAIVLKGTTSDSVTIPLADFLYAEAVGNYVKVYQWSDNELRTDMIRATMKQVEGDLQASRSVVRCHRAFLVNLQQVEQIVTRSGAMHLLIRHSHDSIPVSRSNVAQVKEAIQLLIINC